MRKNKILKLTALVLSAVMLAGVGYTALPVEAEDTISGSYYNFEDGEFPTGFSSTDSAVFQVDTEGDTKAVTHSVKTKQVMYYDTEELRNNGIKPSNVSFRFKYEYDPTATGDMNMFRFHPMIARTDYSVSYLGRDAAIVIITKKEVKDVLCTVASGSSQHMLGDVAKNNGFWFGEGNLNTDEWITFNCEYTWGDTWGQANTTQVLVCTVTLTQGGKDLLSEPARFTFTENGNVSYINNYKGSGFSFTFGESTGKKCIDNIAVTWTDGTTTYAPTYAPEPKALGATLATTEGTDGSIKTQMGFKFTDARTALEKNGATVSEYGAVFVAGTKDYDTMKTNAASVIGGTAVDGYVKTVKAEAELPDEYRVTITNSDGENIGKRVTAIGYVKTTDGAIYYTGENTSDDIVQANLNNYSVMSTLKKIFAQKYLADPNDSSGDGMIDEITTNSELANALASYNSAATLTDIKDAIADGVSTGNTTNGFPKRELLKSIHFALYNSYQ